MSLERSTYALEDFNKELEYFEFIIIFAIIVTYRHIKDRAML